MMVQQSATPLAEEYLAAGRQMEELYDGARLREAAEDMLEQLPAGPLVLLAASQVGAGLAATCAALRDEPTAWSRVTLTHAEVLPALDPVIFIEPIVPDGAWVQLVRRRYPDAVVVVPRQGPLAALAA